MAEAKAKIKVACPGCRQKLDVTDIAPFIRVNCPSCGGAVIAPRPFGTILLEEPLEYRGGVGSYRALDLTLDREVLVKILECDPGASRDGFLALAREAAAVNHPGVVPIYSCGIEQGTPYLVSQFMPGGSLAARLAGWSPTEESIRQAVGWTRQVAAGLQAAAGQGVIHGAVSPLCILLDGEGSAKVAGFGLDALLAGPRGQGSGYGGDVVGYLSPEVLNGGQATAVSDVFGLGAVLYHLLAGQCPCGVVADGEAAKRLWLDGYRPSPPRSVNEQVSQELSDLCMRMLCANPGGRPAEAGDLVQALASAYKMRPTKLAVKRSSSAGASAIRAQPPRRRRCVAALSIWPRRRWMDLLIFASACAVLTLGGLLYLRTHRHPSWLGMPSCSSERLGDSLLPLETVGTSAPTPVDVQHRDAPGASSDAEPVAVSPAVVVGATTSTPVPLVENSTLRTDNLGAYAARRPRPVDLDFRGARQALAHYLKSLPGDLLADERERLALIGDTRSYLARLMKYVPFMAGKETDIRLRSGRVLRGVVPYGNEAQVAVRVTGGDGLRMLGWGELAPEQIIAILDFYMQLRQDQGQVAGGATDTARQEVAEDCLRAAVLCDWYERPELAARYAHRAVTMDRSCASRAKRLLPTLTF